MQEEHPRHRAGVLVAGTDTGVGKTRVVAGLIRALRRLGCRSGGMKPVASGTMSANGVRFNEDVCEIAAACAPYSANTDDLNPYCFDWPVSPHIAAERAGILVDPDRTLAARARLAQRYDDLVVEGTGGRLAPIGPRATMAEVAAALDLPVVLVLGLRLGCLSHAVLSARAIATDGARLIGWIGSAIDPAMSAQQENLESLGQRLPAPMLGLLPHARERDGDAARFTGASPARSLAAENAASV